MRLAIARSPGSAIAPRWRHSSCGLRRSELAALTFEHIQQRDGRWCIIHLVGKHGRVRTVPAPGWVGALIDRWAEAAGIATTAFVFLPLRRGGHLTACDRLVGGKAVWRAVRKYVTAAGFNEHHLLALAPHDMRRTFAKLADQGGASLPETQFALGHASVVTTERYLGRKQNLQDAPCDHLGLKVQIELPAA